LHKRNSSITFESFDRNSQNYKEKFCSETIMNIEISKANEAHDVMTAEPAIGSKVAIRDIAEALSKYRLALIFGWQDVAQRYRRSRVGAFWLTLNTAVFIGALGLIFGTLFQ